MNDDEQQAFDAIMGSLDTPLVVVTTAAHGERAGCVVGFHSQCSITPRRPTAHTSFAPLPWMLAIA